MHSARPGLRRLLWLLSLLIVYLSLYPFRFGGTPVVSEPPWSVLDMVANVLLFLPFGLLARWLAEAGSRNQLAILLLLGAALAAGLQWLQLLVPGRLASLLDVGMNWLGLGLGAWLAPWLTPWLPAQPGPRPGLAGLGAAVGLLLLCWLVAQLSPFVPASPGRAWARQVFALERWPWQFALCFSQALAWMLLLSLVRAELGPRWRWWPALLVVLATLALQPWLIGNVLRWEELVAPLLALAGYALGLGRPRWLLVLVLVWLGWRGLSPFHLQPVQQPFHLLPFGALVQTPLPFALAVVAEKAFWYGGLCELGWRSGWRSGRWPVVAALLLLALEWGQRSLPGHRAESTDPLLLLVMALLLHTVRGRLAERPGLSAGRERANRR